MEWNLSPEQDAYQEAFRGWLADIAPPDAVRRWLDAGEAAPLEKLFTDGGWGGVGLPTELGGQGGGLVELALTAEELVRAAAPSAGWLATVLAVPALARAPRSGRARPGRPDPGLPRSGRVRARRGPAAVRRRDRRRQRIGAAGPGGRRSRLVRRTHWPGTAARGGRRLPGHPDHAQAARPLPVGSRRDPWPGALAPARARRPGRGAAAGLGPGGRVLRRRLGGRGRSRFLPARRRGQGAGQRRGARTADSALTLHGAIGYTWEYDLQLFFKRARLDEKLFGTPAQWNERIATGLALV